MGASVSILFRKIKGRGFIPPIAIIKLPFLEGESVNHAFTVEPVILLIIDNGVRSILEISAGQVSWNLPELGFLDSILGFFLDWKEVTLVVPGNEIDFALLCLFLKNQVFQGCEEHPQWDLGKGWDQTESSDTCPSHVEVGQIASRN